MRIFYKLHEHVELEYFEVGNDMAVINGNFRGIELAHEQFEEISLSQPMTPYQAYYVYYNVDILESIGNHFQKMDSGT